MELQQFSLSMIPRNAYPAAFLFVFILTLILSIMFIFHWRKYAQNSRVATLVTVVYVLGTIGLLVLSASLLTAVYFT